MTNHHMSSADNILRGAASFEPHKRLFDGRRGYLVVDNALRNYGAPLAVAAAALINSATGAQLPNAATINYAPATDGTVPLNNASRPTTATVMAAGNGGTSLLSYVLDVPRNVVLTATHASSLVAMTLLVQGMDEYQQLMSELLTVTATGTSKTVTGKKAFKYIYNYQFVSAGNATTNTAAVAWGNTMGLPYRVDAAERVVPLGAGNVDSTGTVVKADDTSPATSTTGDVRGTYTPVTAPDGTRKYFAVIYPTDPQTAQPLGLFGNVQA